MVSKIAPVDIIYREDGMGKGPFFDHYCFRKITGRETRLTIGEGQKINVFKEQIKDRSAHVLDLKNKHKVVPEKSSELVEKMGLLVVPGRPRKKSKRQTQREIHENKVLRDALLRGRPTLLLCAGSWSLLNQNLNEKEKVGSLKNTKGHCARRMPAIIKNGFIGYNMQIHKIKVESHTLLSAAMFNKLTNFPNPMCNSVHWAACDETTLHPAFQVSARSTSEISKTTSLQPEKNAVEAIETKYGAPVLAIQWHPEAYYAPKGKFKDACFHTNILHYMAKAGDAFYKKQKLLREIKKYEN